MYSAAPYRWDPNRYYYYGSVNLRVLAMNGYSTYSKDLGKDLVSYPGYSLMLGEGLSLCRDALGVFYSPRRLGESTIGCLVPQSNVSFYYRVMKDKLKHTFRFKNFLNESNKKNLIETYTHTHIFYGSNRTNSTQSQFNVRFLAG